MKKYVSILLAVILCLLSFAMPSNALADDVFSYEVVNDKIVITKYVGTNQTGVTVPASINGMPVSAIGEGAFKNNKELKTVIVSEGVKDIGDSAFENCTSLATITLPTTIVHIGEKAIYNTAYYNNTSNWKKSRTSSSSGGVGFGSGIEQIPWEDIVARELEYLYLGKNLIEISFSGSYTVKSGTLVIADGAFAGCGAERVTLSKTLVAIGANAFKDCKNLKEVTIPENIEIIGDSAFEGCISLEEINLPDKYIEMSSSSFYNTGFYNNSDNWENNILYLGNTVVDTRRNNEIVEIKDEAKYVAGNALGENDVFIPKTVTKISEKAFSDSTISTVFGYTGIYAQEYATMHNMNFVAMDNIAKGDVNYDGNINTDDYKILCEIATTQRMPNLIEKMIGDMDEDGAIDSIDAIILDLMLNNMPPSRLKGDVNGDNNVDTEDYDLLVKFVSTEAKITDNIMFIRADINQDGAVDSFDAVYLDLALNRIVAIT